MTQRWPDSVPELGEGRVRLRAHTSADVPRMVEQSSDAVSRRWTSVPRPYTRGHAEGFLEIIRAGWDHEGGNRLWAIEWRDHPDGPSYAGTIDLRPQDSGEMQLGYGLHPDTRGGGVMSGAVRLAARWWFDQGGRRVHWTAFRGNFDSWRVAWACGFRMHATLPEHGAHPEGPACDEWVASLGRDDPMEPATRWHTVPVLEAEGVRLRPWRDGDAAFVEEPRHPAHHMPVGAAPTRVTFADWLLRRRERISRGEALHWCIADAGTDRALGDALLITAGQDDVAEVGYQLFPSARGRGVATAAARLAVAHALAPVAAGGLGARRLLARTAADNTSSNRVLERTGFEVFGRERAVDLLPDGSTVDLLHWQR